MSIRQAAIVLGMHRGGTSALAGVLSHLGLHAPRTPLAPAPDNPSGFFESVPIVAANHYILTAVGCNWDTCLAFDAAETQQRLAPSVTAAMLDVLQKEFGDSGPFVLKDPRLCVMLPLWRAALEQFGAEERCLLIIRHPAEVCRSLADRNGLSSVHAVSLWLHHLLEAERFSRGRPRAIMMYDDLMTDWRSSVGQALQVSGLTCPRSIDAAAPEVDAFLSAGLRHHTAERSAAAMGPMPVRNFIGSAWLAFAQLARVPEDATALDCLDETRAAFAQWRRQIRSAA